MHLLKFALYSQIPHLPVVSQSGDVIFYSSTQADPGTGWRKPRIIVPILVVSLISGYGSTHLAIRLGFLACLSSWFIGEMMYGMAIGGMGYQFSICCHMHNDEMMYAIMLVMGFTGLFIDRVLIKYAGILVKKIGGGREIAFGNHQ